MTQTQILHARAMEAAEGAFLARRRGDETAFRQLTAAAFGLERQAAESLRDAVESEPSRSVLYRSAASLAIECSEWREAERLLAQALLGEPPDEIAEEIRGLQDAARFRYHLFLGRIALIPGHISLRLRGQLVGEGFIISTAFVERVRDLEKLIRRTAERLQGTPYREHGPSQAALQKMLNIFILAPRPGSFEVTLRVGSQMALPGFDKTEEVLTEVLDCVELLDENKQDKLQNRIADEAYFRNFVGLARSIAPDGVAVTAVALSASTRDKPRTVLIERRRSDIAATSGKVAVVAKAPAEELTGRLLFANALGKPTIKILTESGKTRPIAVPEGMMEDIVRPLWADVVVVRGHRKGRALALDTIERVPPESA